MSNATQHKGQNPFARKGARHKDHGRSAAPDPLAVMAEVGDLNLAALTDRHFCHGTPKPDPPDSDPRRAKGHYTLVHSAKNGGRSR
jgi:hypothetical protein